MVAVGCGGAKSESTARRAVAGPGYRFPVPADWKVTRAGSVVSARPGSGEELVSVTVFRLEKPYRAALWPRVVPELDGVARKLARQLGGSVDESTTRVVAARRARSYRIVFTRSGTELVEHITFVLVGRREYQLLCRTTTDRSDIDACGELISGFRLG